MCATKVFYSIPLDKQEKQLYNLFISISKEDYYEFK